MLRSRRSAVFIFAAIAVSTVAIISYAKPEGRDAAAGVAAPGKTLAPDVTRSTAAPPSNDTFAGAIPLSVNRSVRGNFGSGGESAANDYELAPPGTPTCFFGDGQIATPSSAAGRDLVYSFTAPGAGNYSFRVGYTGETDNEDLVIYLVDGVPTGMAPVSIPCQASGATPPVAVAAANRNTVTSQPSEEVFSFPMSAGQQIYLVVDEAVAGTAATAFFVEVFDAKVEVEPNDTFATAQVITCDIEGNIKNAAGPIQDFDYFSIGTPPDGSRLFAIVDGAASNSSNFDMRINNATTTYQYADFYNDIEQGTTSPNIGGLALAAANGPYAIQVDYLGTTNTAVHEPYRLIHVIQPPSSSAVAESEPNDTLAMADSDAGNYFTGIFSSISDSDWYATAANAGDLLFVSVDCDPARNGNNPNASFELIDSSGNLIYSLQDNSSTTTAGFPPAAGQAATTPVAPAEATLFRIPATGIYYLRLFPGSVNATGPNDYLLSIAKNCTPGAGGTILPGAGSLQFGVAAVSEIEGRTATVQVSRTEGTTGAVTVNYATANGTAAGGAACGAGVDFIHTSGMLSFVEGEALKSFTVTLCSDALNEGTETITLNLSAATGGASLGTPNPAAVRIVDVASQFCSTGSISIPASGSSPVAAAPYPSNVVVSGLTGTITGLRVTLYDAEHGNPDDVDVLLVGPAGQNFIILSDAGGGAGLDAAATITLSDAASLQVPDSGMIDTNSYRPSNFSFVNDTFAAGAPAAPYGNPGPGGTPAGSDTLASIFNGTDPNGTWRLYVSDDTAASNGGSISGWCLEIGTTASPALQVASAVSRKNHGSAGDFEIDLPLNGEPGVECRSSGGAHTLVVTFTNNVVSGNASVTAGTGSVSGNPIFSGNTMTVNLTGVADVQQIALSLSNVTDSFNQTLPSTIVRMNVLAGDTNASKTVSAADVSQTKAQAGAPVTSANFRQDVTPTGSISAADISLVKSRSGQFVP